MCCCSCVVARVLQEPSECAKQFVRGFSLAVAFARVLPDPYSIFMEPDAPDAAEPATAESVEPFFFLTLVVVLGETTDRRGVITPVCAASLSFLLSLDLMPKHADLRGCYNFLIQTVRRPGMIFPH